MFNIICITNTSLCKNNFFNRINEIASNKPYSIVLREKELSKAQYLELAKKVIAICNEKKVTCTLHSYPDIAKKLNCKSLHMPFNLLLQMSEEEKSGFTTLGASCHSVSEAKKAYALGCNYITAGHIFKTDCKKGVSPRGLDFLKEVCSSVPIPVFAIGGITPDKVSLLKQSGASGCCLMSSLMTSEDVTQLISQFK